MSEENQIEQPVEQEQQARAAAQPETATYDLTIQDLNAIKTIIDAAAQRGAFKPAEMEVVGKTYNKLVGFLTTVAKQGEQNA